MNNAGGNDFTAGMRRLARPNSSATLAQKLPLFSPQSLSLLGTIFRPGDPDPPWLPPCIDSELLRLPQDIDFLPGEHGRKRRHRLEGDPFLSSQDMGLEFSASARRRKRTRLGLPITLDPQGVAATVLACADTGSDVNIMSAELIEALGYTGYEALLEAKQFKLANGKIVEAVGKITSRCAFGVEADSEMSMSCLFYILARVVAPIIMGIHFLEETNTMTEHRERLVRVPRPALQALSVCSIDRPRKVLSCSSGHKPTTATADTGSEIDLIHPEVVSDLGMLVHPGKEALELADGSIAITSGYVSAPLSLNDLLPGQENPYSAISTTVDFYLLHGLTHRVLVGEETLEELRVFTNNRRWLIPAISDTSAKSSLRSPHYLLSGENNMPSFNHKLNLVTKPDLGGWRYSGDSTIAVDQQCRAGSIRCLGAGDRLFERVKKKFERQPTTSGHKLDVSNRDDQRENHRRELEMNRIATLPASEQQAAIDVELLKQTAYNNITSSTNTAANISNSQHASSIPPTRNVVSSPSPHPSYSPSPSSLYISSGALSPSSSPGPLARCFSPGLDLYNTTNKRTFTCDYPGCNALAFQTQYLLNSHQNVHTQQQLHYCPVAGCPRSEGGKGFKRWYDMIRHDILHHSSGYACPFCPDQEVKFRWPGILHRHVRVHHPDKDRDDPKLKDRLKQWYKTGRGRR